MALFLLFLIGMITSIALRLWLPCHRIACLDALCGTQTDNIKRLLNRHHHMLDTITQSLTAFTVNDREKF